MRKALYFFLIFTTLAHAQSFQWGKRGGATDAIPTNGAARQEEVYSIVTDSNKNIYILSAVGKNGLDIDGVDKTNFGDNTSLTDHVLASFACDGTYRWSKIIGGEGREIIQCIQIDSQDNIYVAGRFGGCGDTTYPPRIDSDVIIPQSPIDCRVNFLAKYNSSGVLQWLKRPQPAVSSISSLTNGFSVDAAGNSYWMIRIPPGTYADGAFVNTATGDTWHLFRYDSNGNFISATPIDLQTNSGGFFTSLKFYRNPYNGYLYFTSQKSGNTDTAVVGGQNITHTVFIACFNNLGQFQWVREDSGTISNSIILYNLEFDSNNNIYLGGRMLGLNSNTFLGFTVPTSNTPGFIMKVDPMAQNLIWSSYNNKDAIQRGALAINGNEIGWAGICFAPDFTWGTQSLNVNPAGSGTEALLARFDRSNGNCLGLTKIPGNVGFDDAATALAVDASGDYIIGGGFGGTLSFTTNTITKTGSQSDFFVAKYSTSPCSLGQDEFETGELLLYPNPAENDFTIAVTETMQYQVYNLTGSLVMQGVVTPENGRVDCISLAAGCYLVSVKNDNGIEKRTKLIKK